MEGAMPSAILVKGRLVGPTTITLDEPAPESTAEIEVILRMRPDLGPRESLADFLRSLPPGTRTKTDIDFSLRQERGSWD